MIAFDVIREVKRLLAERELSQRAIALRTGISRGTVHNVATGKRPDYEARAEALAAANPPPPDELAVRCAGCGGLVHLPCRACATRNAKPLPRSGFSDCNVSRLAIDLHDEDRARYESIHAAKKAAAQPAPIEPAWDRLEEAIFDDKTPIDEQTLFDALDPIGDDFEEFEPTPNPQSLP